MKRIAGFVLVLVLVFSISYAQAASVGFFASPKARFWDSTGTKLLTQGYLVFCPVGTSCGCTSFTSGVTTYTDSTAVTPNTNPVYLDSQGSAAIWFAGSVKAVACDRFGVIQWSTDNVPAVTLFSSSGVSEYLPTSLTPTYIGATQFSVLGDQHLVFAPGRRLQITVSSGTNYYTVSASSFSSGVTTITVIPDTLNLDSGISAVNTGILNVTSPSAPIRPVVTKAGNYTGTAADCGSTIEFALTSTATYTLPAANTVPSGCSVISKNTSTWTVTIGGTVDGVSNPTLTGQYSQMMLFSDATSWFGKPVSPTAAANVIPVAGSDGSLASGWAGLINIQTLTTGTIYTPTPKTHKIIVEVQGGGGGGGGATNVGSAPAGGGGGGGYARKLFTGISGTYAYTIGSGGPGGSNTANGTAGTDSTFISMVTVTGSGGSGGVSYTNGFGPVSGGAATSGDVNIPGQDGGRGSVIGAGNCAGGKGGDSQLGRGGQYNPAQSASQSGLPGSGYGGGGSGSANGSGAAQTGGAGAPGIIIVQEFS